MPGSGDLFGRDREVDAVVACLDGLASGPCGLLLEGEAGIGKTALWMAGVAAAAARSYLILSSRPAEAEAALSFAGLGDLLAGTIRSVVTGLPPPQQHALEVALLLTPPAGRPPAHRAVCAAFLGAIRGLAAGGPVLIAIDDLHWLDPATATVLGYALRRLTAEPVGLLASVRAGHDSAPLTAVGPRADRLTRLQLGPLPLADFEAVIRASVGGRLSRLTIRRIFETSGGNVFYGCELARALGLLDAEPPLSEPLPVPAGLQGVLTARIASLPADVQEVLLTASCLRSPTAALLERASGPSSWHAVQSAAAQGLVTIEGASVRFTHPLLASAIYSGVAPWQRREAHRTLSMVATNPEELARHQALAADGPDEDVAAALALAARAAIARGAPGAAAELAELAVAYTPARLGSASRRRRLAAAEYSFRAGDTSRARQGLEAVVADMPSGPRRAEALMLLAKVLLHDAGDPVAVPVLERALAEAAADRRLQARIHIGLARTCGFDLRYCANHADIGLALAEQAGDRALARQAQAEKMYADFMLGRDVRMDPPDHPIGGGPERAWSAVEDRGTTIVGVCLVRADLFDEGRRLLESALAAAQDEGDESSLPVLLAHLADLEVWAGNWQAAARYATQSWEAGEHVEHRAWRAATLYARALIDAHLGRIDVARTEAADGLAVATAAADDWAVMMLRAALGFAELSAGNSRAAAASLSGAVTLADRIGVAEPAAWRFDANYIEALVSVGDLDRAAERLAWLEARGRATGRRWTLATGARCRGLLLAARGNTPGALAALDEALVHHEQLAMPFERARTLLVTGQIQRRARHKAVARRHLDDALAIFASLPAPTWVARARAELSRIGLRPPAPLELTATEERIAALAASGQTNRQVAAALMLSPRTIEANLARAYRKLGVSSRAELGAAMVHRQVARPHLDVETPDSSDRRPA